MSYRPIHDVKAEKENERLTSPVFLYFGCWLLAIGLGLTAKLRPVRERNFGSDVSSVMHKKASVRFG